MSRKPVEALFDALYALTDVRMIFRETAPKHELTDEQKDRARKALAKVRQHVDVIEKELKL